MSKEISRKAISQEMVNIADIGGLINFANTLKQIVVENNLYSKVKNKNFVNVEGWQIAGAYMGIRPMVKNLTDLSEGAKFKYRAEVELVNTRNGEVVGRGIAICSNMEPGRKASEEYAIASMAQTRAISKAYRSVIGWVMKMAGYESSPTEEISDIQFEVEEQTPKESSLDREAELKSATTQEELKKIYSNLPVSEKARLKNLKDELKNKFQGESQ